MNSRTEFINRPFRVYWRGFETDTLALKRSGWKIDVMEDMHFHACRFVFRHPKDNCQGMCMITLEQLVDVPKNVMLPLTVEMNFSQTVYVDPVRFRGRRFEPMGYPMHHSEVAERGVPIGHLGLFARDFEQPESKIIIPNETVPELLERIKSMQVKGQKEILEKARKNEVQVKSSTNIIAIA